MNDLAGNEYAGNNFHTPFISDMFQYLSFSEYYEIFFLLKDERCVDWNPCPAEENWEQQGCGHCHPATDRHNEREIAKQNC